MKIKILYNGDNKVILDGEVFVPFDEYAIKNGDLMFCASEQLKFVVLLFSMSHKEEVVYASTANTIIIPVSLVRDNGIASWKHPSDYCKHRWVPEAVNKYFRKLGEKFVKSSSELPAGIKSCAKFSDIYIDDRILSKRIPPIIMFENDGFFETTYFHFRR